MKICLLLLIFIVLTITGCAKKDNSTTTDNIGLNNLKVVNTDSIRYLALGDSYTVGQSVSQSESFPYQFTGSLTTLGFKPAQPLEIAVTGWTSSDLINAIAVHSLLPDNFDFVTLLIGVNDQHDGVSQADYRTNFAQLLQTAITYAKGDKTRVFVLSLPDWGVTPFAGGEDATIGPEIDAFNAINLQESQNAGVNYFSITAISRQAATDPALLAADGLHPSGLMYAEWVGGLLPMVVGRINKTN